MGVSSQRKRYTSTKVGKICDFANKIVKNKVGILNYFADCRPFLYICTVMVLKEGCYMIRVFVLLVVLLALSVGDVVARTTAKRQFSVADNASDVIYRKNGKRNWWEENQTYSTRFRAEQLVVPISLVGIGALEKIHRCAE